MTDDPDTSEGQTLDPPAEKVHQTCSDSRRYKVQSLLCQPRGPTSDLAADGGDHIGDGLALEVRIDVQRGLPPGGSQDQVANQVHQTPGRVANEEVGRDGIFDLRESPAQRNESQGPAAEAIARE